MNLLALLGLLLSAIVTAFHWPDHQFPLTRTYGSKHRSRYGLFTDTLPTSKTKTKRLVDGIDLPEEEEDVKTGAELRRSRIRNLKEAQKAIPEIEYRSPPGPTRNWSDEEINQAILCLNLTYGNKPREELSDEERVGLINWEVFDTHAAGVIPNYSDERTRKKVVSWILYHRKKMDIRYVGNSWVFDPKGSPKRLYKRLSKKKLEVYNK